MPVPIGEKKRSAQTALAACLRVGDDDGAFRFAAPGAFLQHPVRGPECLKNLYLEEAALGAEILFNARLREHAAFGDQTIPLVCHGIDAVPRVLKHFNSLPHGVTADKQPFRQLVSRDKSALIAFQRR